MASLTARATTVTTDTPHVRAVSKAVLLLTAVSLLKALLLLMGFLLGGSTERANPFSPWLRAMEVVAFGTTSALLVVLVRHDGRAVTLAGLLALVAAAYGDSLNDRSNPLLNVLDVRLRVDAFLPFMVWSFASVFPSSATGTRFSTPCRVGTTLSAVVGSGLAAVALSPFAADPLSVVQAVVRGSPQSVYWPLVTVLTIPALAMLWARAAAAPTNERRRFTLLAATMAAGLSPIALLILGTSFSSAFRHFTEQPAGRMLVGSVAYLALLVVPWGTTHAVLVDRALDVHFVVRSAVRYVLGQQAARLLVAGPLVALGVLIYQQRQANVADLLVGAPAPAFVALLTMTLLAVRYRKAAAGALERRFLRDRHHARTVVAALPHLVNRATSIDELGTRVDEGLRRALRVRGASVAWVSPSGTLDDTLTRGGMWQGVRQLAPLVRPMSGLTRHVSRHDRDWRPMTMKLSPDGQAFLEAAGIEAMVPLVSGPATTGLLLLEARPDEVPLDGEELELLDTVATSAGARLEALRSAGAAGQVTLMTGECEACGLVLEADLCPCGGTVRQGAVPRDLRGKIFFRRRLGAGAFGAVYLARDVDLNQDRAVKAIRLVPGKIALETVRHEAMLMAAVRHPNLLVIHALEAQGDSAFLVSELMERGTLAERLRHGALPPSEVVTLGAQLGSALRELHRANVLHRDIKPSNIGFASDLTAKLMDFGLAVESAAEPRGEARFVGTPPYVSPEVAAGGAWTAPDDVWSLTMVLLECAIGVHPLKHVAPVEVLATLRGAKSTLSFLPTTQDPTVPAVAQALVKVLHNRERTATELLSRLGHPSPDPTRSEQGVQR